MPQLLLTEENIRKAARSGGFYSKDSLFAIDHEEENEKVEIIACIGLSSTRKIGDGIRRIFGAS